MVEVPDHEYKRLLGQDQVVQFIQPIIDSPQTGPKAKALIKEVYPQVSIPDYDLRQEFNQKIEDMKKQQEDTERAKQQAAQKAEWDTQKGEVKKEYGFTEDGIKDLEKYMVENNIGSYKIAAEYRASKNPKPIDAHHHDGFWHHTKSEGFGEIAKDPEGWAHNEIYGALLRDQERMKNGR